VEGDLKITIYRGAKEIGGTFIEIKTSSTRILLDAGYPLFLNGDVINRDIQSLNTDELLSLGVLPSISGLYYWDYKSFDAVIISHAHTDHFGLLKYINPEIPVYMSKGTEALIRLSQQFKIAEAFNLNIHAFELYKNFCVGDISIMSYLMDHSAFDAAAFEIQAGGKTVIYSGDFRAHGRKSICFEKFIKNAKKKADTLLVESTVLGRTEQKTLSEDDLENLIVQRMRDVDGPLLFQSSGQNIDRLVTFNRASIKLNRIFVVDVYTANVLHELRQLGNNLPYPSNDYPNIKVFYPYRLTKKIFNEIGENYARRFSAYRISRQQLEQIQNKIMMICRPSMLGDLKSSKLKNGVFFYSLWSGYRTSEYQQRFESELLNMNFSIETMHTSGHASVSDIKQLIDELDPKRIVPIHTLKPEDFLGFADNVFLSEDGIEFDV